MNMIIILNINPLLQDKLTSYWRRKKSVGSSDTRVKHSVLEKRQKNKEIGDTNERERRSSESEAGYENVSEKVGNAFLQIGGSSFKSDYFGKIPGNDVKPGASSPSSSYHQAAQPPYNQPVLTTPTPSKATSKKCYVKPQKKCKTTPKEECKQVSVN